MALLGNLFGLGRSQRRGFGSSMWSRGASRRRYSSFGRAHAPSSGMFGGSLGRMALGVGAAMLTRSFINRRSRYY